MVAGTRNVPPAEGSARRGDNPVIQLVGFRLDNEDYAIAITKIQEIILMKPITRIPQVPDFIEGLINLRGQIVTAIDMRRKLKLPPRGSDQAPMNVVVRTQDGPVSLLVDEIGDVLDVDAATYERPPDNIDPQARHLIHGVYKLKDRLLLVLDAERTVDLS